MNSVRAGDPQPQHLTSITFTVPMLSIGSLTYTLLMLMQMITHWFRSARGLEMSESR